jgi:ribosomal protein S18 acetylase RimI-like enzyme
VRIRQVDIDDGPRLWALRLEMLADAPLAYLDTLDRAVARGLGEYHHRVRGWVTQPDRALFVAEQDGALTGHLGAVDERGYTGLVMVYVSPAARGRGVLKGLVDAAAEWSRVAGRRELLLEVMERNHRAIRAYEKLGFAVTGTRHPHPYLTPFTELEMIRRA